MRSDSPTGSNLEVPKSYQVPEKSEEDSSSPRQNSLDVPKPYTATNGEPSSEADPNTCLALAVPNKVNIVAPWEVSD